MQYNKLFTTSKPLIGVIHLPPLVGYDDHPGINAVIEKALQDLKTLEDAGIDGVLVENDGDHPPHIGFNQKISDSFAEVMKVVKEKAHIPLGLEILYDMPGTIELAAKVKADFVRLDVFVDDVQTRYGPQIFGEEDKLNALRNKLHPDLLLFTDIQVKHTTMLDTTKPIIQSAKEAIAAGSNGIIITGVWTGKEPDLDEIKEVKDVVGNIPILVGSGFSAENAEKFIPYIDGVIVASSIKTGEYIDSEKAKELVEKVRSNI